MKKLRLSAIRLVGFHNYEDVIVPVRGDLFAVGANESGKTTLLDAVHLVLSGDLNVDWNAAASLAGLKQSGRTLQGIILRANMAGKPVRIGGSISYAVVELQPVEGNGKPTSMVFGASATDMHTQVHKWGAIVNCRAADLNLTEAQPDGSHRILDRDEFEARLGGRVYKGHRGIGDYRTAVAEQLFADRDSFEAVTRLWRTAKSYREIAEKARNISEVFRHVLPAPDPEPFQKIAKGFRDIAQIEEDLQELSRDVEALHGLRTQLLDAREARETVRRYAFVQSSWSFNDTSQGLERARSDQTVAREQLRRAESEVTHIEYTLSILKERLANLRESDNYRLLASLDAKQAQLEMSERRVANLSAAIAELKRRLTTSEFDRDQCRDAACSTLDRVHARLNQLAEGLLEVSSGAAEQLQDLKSQVPNRVDDPVDSAQIEHGLQSVRQRLNQGIADFDERLRADAEQQKELQSQIHDHAEQLCRLQQFPDLVPSIPCLDAVLSKLSELRMPYKLLFQHLEWRPDTAPELQSAVESAFGIPRLATVVVSPKDTPAARQIVLEAGCGIRVLDAVPVSESAISSAAGDRLPDFVVADDQRVDAHLRETVGETTLVTDIPEDGANADWFAQDGISGERGARWKLELGEPRWIGERRRQEIRDREVRDLEEVIIGSERLAKELADELARQQTAHQTLRETLTELNNLGLPWSVRQPIEEFRRANDATEQLSKTIRDQVEILAEEELQKNGLVEAIADLEKQIEGTQAKVIKEQIGLLEKEKSDLEGRMVECRSEKQTREKEIDKFDDQIQRLQSELHDLNLRLTEARNRLVLVLAPEQAQHLERYVFETKRGSQLKAENLDEKRRAADRREAELLAQLRGADGVMNVKLATRYGFRLEDDDAVLMIRDRSDLELDGILEERREQERQIKESLNEKTRELFEVIFARDLTERLRNDLFKLRRTVSDVNRVLQPLTFGHNRFQIHARPATDHQRLVEIIGRQGALNDESRDQLRHYLEDRRDQLMIEGDVPQFLDYRYWFDYSFRIELVASDTDASMSSEDMIRGSVGAQATHNYLLLLALAALLFDRSQARLRLLMLDDAFFGLQTERKELLLQCGKKLGLDFVIATPDLDGTIQEHAGDSTTVLVEKDEQENVTVLPIEWERIKPQGLLFPEPSLEAVGSPAQMS